MAKHSKLCFIVLLSLLHAKFITSQAPVPAPVPHPGKPREPPTPTPESPPAKLPPSPLPLPPPPSSTPQPHPPEVKPKGKKALSGGQKAGIVIGTFAGAGLLWFAGMVYKKRRSNIRRARFGSQARRAML